MQDRKTKKSIDVIATKEELEPLLREAWRKLIKREKNGKLWLWKKM